MATKIPLPVGNVPWRAATHLLSVASLEVIDKIPRLVGERDFVFSVNGEKPVQSYADAKVRIDRRMAELLDDFQHWTITICGELARQGWRSLVSNRRLPTE